MAGAIALKAQEGKTKQKAGGTQSLTEAIYAQLRQEILRCSLRPGTDLSEAELAVRFGVSKTPVREALAALRLDGLIRTFPRRGYQVSPITLGDITELFDVRTILEAGAVELAVRRITREELDELERLAEASYDPQAEPTIGYFIDANRDFHLAIARASGNSRLVDLIERQIDQLERFFYLGATLRDVNAETNSEHHQIVEILATREPEAARATIIRHNNATRQGLLMALAQSPGFGEISL